MGRPHGKVASEHGRPERRRFRGARLPDLQSRGFVQRDRGSLRGDASDQVRSRSLEFDRHSRPVPIDEAALAECFRASEASRARSAAFRGRNRQRLMMSKPRVPEDIAGRAGAAALAGLLVALLNPLPCAAAEPAIRLAPAAGSVTEYSAKVGAPSLNAEVRLRNTSNDPAQYRLGPFLTRSSDGLAYPATWRRLDAPVGDPSFAAAGADFVLQLSANLAEPGIYESWIDTFQKNATSGAETPDQRIHVVVTRE